MTDQRVREIIFEYNAPYQTRLTWLESRYNIIGDLENVTARNEKEIREQDIRLLKAENLTLVVTALRFQITEQAKHMKGLSARLAALEPHDHVCKTCEVKY
jgi:uncharacterized coiled-coil protein SlyX